MPAANQSARSVLSDLQRPLRKAGDHERARNRQSGADEIGGAW